MKENLRKYLNLFIMKYDTEEVLGMLHEKLTAFLLFVFLFIKTLNFNDGNKNKLGENHAKRS